MLSMRGAFCPSISEKAVRLSTAARRFPFSEEKSSAMSPVMPSRWVRVPEMLDSLFSSSRFRFSSVRDRSPVTWAIFCLKKSSSEPAMSIRSRLRLERSVSPSAR